MTALEQARTFLDTMFAENKERWATMIALEIVEAQRRAVDEFAKNLRGENNG